MEESKSSNISITPTAPTLICKETEIKGWVIKRSDKYANWRKKYCFILRDQLCFSQDEEEQAHFAVDLRKCSSVKEVFYPQTSGSSISCAIEISINEKVVIFHEPREEYRSIWIDAIQKIISQYADNQSISDSTKSKEKGRAIMTELLQACKNGYLEEIKNLLRENEIDLNAKDNMGCTALYYAANGGHINVVKVLLESGSLPNKFAYNGTNSAIFGAVQRGSYDIVKMLIDAGGNIELKSKAGKPLLTFAIEMGDSSIIELIKSKKTCSSPKSIDKQDQADNPYSSYPTIMSKSVKRSQLNSESKVFTPKSKPISSKVLSPNSVASYSQYHYNNVNEQTNSNFNYFHPQVEINNHYSSYFMPYDSNMMQ
eukprot:gene15405-20780_t